MLDVLRLGAYQAAAHPDPAARRGGHHRRPRPRRRARPGRPASSTRCCAGSPHATGTAGSTELTAGARRERALALRTAHPDWIVERLRGRARRRPGRDRAALAADDDRPQTHLVAWPGRIDPRRAAGRRPAASRARTRPTPCGWPAAIPAELAAIRDRRAGVQDEGSQLCALALGRGPAGRAATSAGSTCAPAPAARPRCSPRSPPRAARTLHGQRAARRTGPNSSGTSPRAWDGRRAGSATPASCPARAAATTGCCSTRRAPGWARCAAARRRAGGAAPDDLAELADAAARAARGGAAPRPARRRRRLRDLLAASGRDPRGRRRARPRSTPARCSPACPTSGDGPTVQLWPHRHGTDAMFCALLRAPGRGH